MNHTAATEVKTVTLLVERFQAQYAQDWPFANDPKYAAHVDILTGMKLVRMIQDVIIQRECVAEYPADWVEAVKERFAPAWFLRRWPVRRSRIDMEVLYPRIAIPADRHPRTVKLKVWTPTDWLPDYSK